MEIEIAKIEGLLIQVDDIIKVYEEEKNKSKESFNFFKILGISTKENYHSKFIAELLNPKGLHSCGNIFLKAFEETIPILKGISTEHVNGGYFKTEEDMGYVPLDYSEGGRADILIRINGHLLLIENKINAGPQPKQLIRYHKYKTKNLKNHSACNILYLTLDDKPPSKESCGDLKMNEDFHCISYQNHIHKWLERCIKTCPCPEEYSVVKETIKGYLTVIKFLTNQTLYHKMQNEIKQILFKNKAHLDAAIELSKIVAIINDESNAKIHEINRLLKAYQHEKGSRPIEVRDVFNHDGLVFYVNIYKNESLPVELEIGVEEYLLSCGGSPYFSEWKKLQEPYKAEDFVNAFIIDLNKYFES